LRLVQFVPLDPHHALHASTWNLMNQTSRALRILNVDWP
jgi:hypothetical protein